MLTVIEESDFDNRDMFSHSDPDYSDPSYSALEESTYNSFLTLFNDTKLNNTPARNTYLSGSTVLVPLRYLTNGLLANRFLLLQMSTILGLTMATLVTSSTKGGRSPESEGRHLINLDFYDLTLEDYNGVPFNFSLLFDKVVMIVNVASFCGFTKQYDELEALYEKYNSKGFEIIAFPLNLFLQEPKSEAQIVEFCLVKYNVSFPIMKKIKVNGKKTSPIYDYLKNQKKGVLNLKRVLWNFEKFLVDKRGNVVERATAFKKPGELESLIVKLLEE